MCIGCASISTECNTESYPESRERFDWLFIGNGFDATRCDPTRRGPLYGVWHPLVLCTKIEQRTVQAMLPLSQISTLAQTEEAQLKIERPSKKVFLTDRNRTKMSQVDQSESHSSLGPWPVNKAEAKLGRVMIKE